MYVPDVFNQHTEPRFFAPMRSLKVPGECVQTAYLYAFRTNQSYLYIYICTYIYIYILLSYVFIY